MHRKSKRTKVLVCSLTSPVGEQCPWAVFATKSCSWDRHRLTPALPSLHVMLGSRKKQHPDCAELLVASRKSNRMAFERWHWRQSPTQSWGKILQQETTALSTGQEMNWKRSERVNRILGADSADNIL